MHGQEKKLLHKLLGKRWIFMQAAQERHNHINLTVRGKGFRLSTILINMQSSSDSPKSLRKCAWNYLAIHYRYRVILLRQSKAYKLYSDGRKK